MADFLPNGTAWRALTELCALSAGPQFDCEFQLQLAPGATPPLRLGVADDQGVPWLGWSTWLRGEAAGTVAEVIVVGRAGGRRLPRVNL